MQLWQWIVIDKGQIKTWLAQADRDEHTPNFHRVGEPVWVSGLMFPMVFGVAGSDLSNMPQRRIFQFQLKKDDNTNEPVFAGNTEQLKILSVLSEWAISISELIEALGWDLIELKHDGLELREASDWTVVDAMRAELILKAGIEVMSYARGFKVFW